MQEQQQQQQQQGTSAWTPVDEKAWSAVPEQKQQEPDKGFVAGAQRGAEQVAGAVKGIPGAIKSAWDAGVRDNDRPQMDVAKDAIAGAKQIPGKLKGMADAADKQWQDDPGGFVGQFLTGQVVPAIAGEALAGGFGAGKALGGVSEDVKMAAQQANADPLKLKLLQAQTDAKKALNLKMANVVGQIDKSPAMLPRTTVYSQLTKYFGDKLEDAPVDVSRLISDSTKERSASPMSSSPGSMTGMADPVVAGDPNMRFGQLDNLRQTIWHSMKDNPSSSALKGAYGEVSRMLNDVADKQGLAEDYKAAKGAIEDFHTNVVPKGGMIDKATDATSEDYNSIMKPLTSPALKAKVQKLKDLGADIDPEDVAARVKAYKTYEKHGNSIGIHSLRPLNMLEAGGGVAGFAAGSAVGHPFIGAELGIQGTRAIRNRLSDIPMPAPPPTE